MNVQRVIAGVVLSLYFVFVGSNAYAIDFDKELEAQNQLSASLVSSLQNDTNSRDAKSNENDALQIRLVAKTRTAAFNYEKSAQD